MITVRDIVIEALSRSNLVSRRQTPPADMFESAYQLLSGIAKKYSNDNLLQFVVADVTADFTKREFVVGETDAEAPEGTYLPVDIDAPLIQKVNRVYWRGRGDGGLGSYAELDYSSPEDFDSYPDGCGVYTAQPVNDLQIVLKTKLLVDRDMEIKVNYNRKWSFGRDSELRIPGQYEELFIVALTHSLAEHFPRLSAEQVKLLEESLAELEKGVKTSTRAVKYVTRRGVVPAISRADFISGRMFLPG